MTLSTICRSIVRFYFNCHHVESSSLYIHSAFTRRLQFACRLVLTFLLCGLVGYSTPLANRLTNIFMIPNLGVVCIQETFGNTLLTIVHVLIAIIPLSIILFFIQHLGLSYQEYLVGEVLLLLTSFCISYLCQKFQIRKLVLWFNALFFVTILNSKTVHSQFIFELLINYFLGMSIALLVSISFFPLFATFDIENCFNYCLLHLDQLQNLILQAFLCQDQTKAKVSLARASVVEKRLYKTMNRMRDRLGETALEPTQLLQSIGHPRGKHINHLTIEKQIDLVTLLMFHIRSLQTMTDQCRFNQYHNDLVEKLHSNLTEFMTCQSLVISAIISPSSITRERFLNHLNNLQTTLDTLNSAYKQVRLCRINEVIQTGIKTQSEDHLSHTFFFFQLNAIVRALRQSTRKDSESETIKTNKPEKVSRDYFIFHHDRSRVFSAIKSMLIIGIGSIFVMVPSLANIFANGQWILIGLCMTQGDTVGGAFTSMKMRLIGILLGSMWAYATYLAVGEVPYKIFLMLIPWLLLFGYLKLVPHWDSAAIVAATTPIVINLGQLYGNILREGNYVLLRIQETIIGIALGVILTMLIFPVFAVDSLKTNIQKTLKTCHHAVESTHLVYDRFFHHEHSKQLSINLEKPEEIRFRIDLHRSGFHDLITSQQTLVDSATLEPSVWWFNYGFSSERYNVLVQEEHDVFRMLHNIHDTLTYINECSSIDHKLIEDLRLNAAGGRFLPDLDVELTDLSKQLNDCIELWISYFTLTKTTYYRWNCIRISHTQNKLIKGDLSANEDSLIELHRTVLRLQADHQQTIDRLLDYYIEKSGQGEELSTLISYVHNDEAESIFVAISAMYYSTIQLVQAIMALGTTIHTIVELETTTVYRDF